MRCAGAPQCPFTSNGEAGGFGLRDERGFEWLVGRLVVALERWPAY